MSESEAFIERISEELLSFPDPIEAEKEILRNKLKSDLYLLCHYLGYNDIEWSVHGEIITALQASTKRKIICVPRGTFKSSIAAIVYPIFLLINDPNLRILIDSELYSNSITYLRSIKLHLASEEMVKVFGNFKTDLVWREDAITIAQRTSKVKEPSISCGGIGTTKVGQHYDVIIGDDYNSPNNTASRDRSQKVIDHYRYNLAILDPDAEYVIIGTRYGEHDLIGWILNEVLGLKKLSEGKFL